MNCLNCSGVAPTTRRASRQQAEIIWRFARSLFFIRIYLFASSQILNPFATSFTWSLKFFRCSCPSSLQFESTAEVSHSFKYTDIHQV